MPSSSFATSSNHPIQIPPDFPKILKQYTKAAIRTQPRDLLLWSVSYFRCLANGEIPPVKERLEYPVPPTESGLTPGLLRVLDKQLGQTKDSAVSKDDLRSKWRGVCLTMHHLEELLHGANLDGESVDWDRFLISAATSLVNRDAVIIGAAGNNLAAAIMEIACEAKATHPEGPSSTLPQDQFTALLSIVAEIEEFSGESLDKVKKHLQTVAETQGGNSAAHNLRSAHCPLLEGQ